MEPCDTPGWLVVGAVAEVAVWRGRAERAEARLVEVEADLAEAGARLVAAEARIVELSEQVAVLSRMLFGRSSEHRCMLTKPCMLHRAAIASLCGQMATL
jgi:hypothetical protein